MAYLEGIEVCSNAFLFRCDPLGDGKIDYVEFAKFLLGSYHLLIY